MTKRILVVDDEADIRAGVCLRLNAAGYATITAEDGDEGIKSAMQNSPSIILLDVLMPKRDGLSTLKELRSQEETRDIPVVMLSASLRDEVRALDAGARYFVQKPYDAKRLLSAVGAAINQTFVESK